MASATQFAAMVALAATAGAAPYKLPKMVSVKAGASASLTARGAWLAHPKSSAPLPTGNSLDPHRRSATDIVDDSGDRVRVRVVLDGADLQLYVGRDALDTVTNDDTQLRTTATVAPLADDDTGARLGDGIVVAEAIAQQGGVSHVKLHWAWDEATIDLVGFIPTASLGKSWDSKVVDGSKPRPQPADPDVSLPPSFELLDAPTGKVFAVRRGKHRAPALRLSTDGALALVRHVGGMDGLAITGWIASKLLTPYKPDDRSIGGVLQPRNDTPLDLYDGRDGQVIGKLWAPSRQAIAQRAGRWVRYDLVTPFGVAPVWAMPSSP